MTEAEAVQIYFTGEWPASHAGQLPVPLGEISFDMTVLEVGTRDARLAECVRFDWCRCRWAVGLTTLGRRRLLRKNAGV